MIIVLIFFLRLFPASETYKPRGKYLCGIYLAKTFAGMLQVYRGYLL